MSREIIEQHTRQYGGSLMERLKDIHRRIGKMCSGGKPPHMTIPARWDDDDMFISVTVDDAISALTDYEAAMKSAAACPVCGGTGQPSTDGRPCACNGTGKWYDCYLYMQAAMQEKDREIAIRDRAVERRNQAIDRLIGQRKQIEADNADLRKKLEDAKEEIERLRGKYELEGICGYIHGIADPENHCKHVMWAKQRNDELADLRAKLAKYEEFHTKHSAAIFSMLLAEEESKKLVIGGELKEANHETSS